MDTTNARDAATGIAGGRTSQSACAKAATPSE